MKRQISIFILVLLVLCSICYAVPPIRTALLLDSGLTISYPQLSYYPNLSNNNYEYFRWWVYNASDGDILTNTTTNCTFNLIDNSGKNILRLSYPTSSMIGFGGLGANACQNCFWTNISKGNFTYYGGYYYQIRCNSIGKLGGFASVYFAYIDTHSYDALFEENMMDTTSGLSVTIFIIVINILLIILPFIKRFSDTEWLNILLSRCCWIIGIYLFILNSTIISTIISSAHLHLEKEIFFYMFVLGWAGYLLMAFMVIKTFLDIMKLWKINKQKKREGEYD
jgi:hypothetical protein